jgi:hypothetical protein
LLIEIVKGERKAILGIIENWLIGRENKVETGRKQAILRVK